MRLTTLLGIGLLVIGALVFIASSGAFDLTSADRGVETETAGDEDALLGLAYDPSLVDRTLLLNSENSDNFVNLFFIAYYEYDSVPLVTLVDNTPSEDLEINISFEESGQNPSVIADLEYDEEMNLIRGDFRCLSSTGGEQEQRFAVAEITVEAEGEDISIDLEREIEVECLQDD